MAVNRINKEESLDQYQNLLPKGKAWPRDKEATLTKFLAAKADVQMQTHNRAVDLLDEADPRTTTDMFEDWEKALGLPDSCVDANQTITQRRSAILAKLTARGGQTPAYYEALLATIDVDCNVVEYPTFKAGNNVAGDIVGQAHLWALELPSVPQILFKAGVSVAGDPLLYQANEQVECLINKHKPAHTEVNFLYGEL